MAASRKQEFVANGVSGKVSGETIIILGIPFHYGM
jgi:hypothetical protein